MCRSRAPATEMVWVPVQSGFTEYVPVPGRQPGGRLPFVATASTWVRFPSPSNVTLSMPSMSRVNPPGRKTVPWIVKAYVPLMVKLLQALAWAVKVDDEARERASRKSEMQDFIVPPEVFRRKADSLQSQASHITGTCGSHV